MKRPTAYDLSSPMHIANLRARNDLQGFGNAEVEFLRKRIEDLAAEVSRLTRELDKATATCVMLKDQLRRRDADSAKGSQP